jgi:hypothetical protein
MGRSGGGVVSFDVLLGFSRDGNNGSIPTRYARGLLLFCLFVFCFWIWVFGSWVLIPPMCSEKGTMLFLASSC